MNKSKSIITRQTLFSDLVRDYPSLSRILLSDYGLHCAGCFANTFDTVENGAKVHGMNEDDIEEMLEHLNSELARQEHVV